MLLWSFGTFLSFSISLGEANAFWNTNLYDCTFPVLIDEWRELWSLHTPSANEFPFGFMQLGPWDENDMNLFPTIRWHQTGDYGVVPNDRLKVNSRRFPTLHDRKFSNCILDSVFSWDQQWILSTGKVESIREISSWLPKGLLMQD